MPALPLPGIELASEWRRVMLRDRGQQCRTLDGLLADVRAGRSRALVVRGEPGIGKTALVDYAAEPAQDLQLARAVGVESEMELPFAALHQLCCQMLSRIGALPSPQHEALGVAFGLRSGAAPDRFLVGLAVLGLLSEVAAGQPLLGLVDDAQWLDQASAQALAVVARRLDSQSVALPSRPRVPGPRGAPGSRPGPRLSGPSRTGCAPGGTGLSSATRWSVPPSTGRHQPPTAAAPTVLSPRPPIREPIPTGGPGTRPRQRPGPMNISPPSWSDLPAGLRHAAAWPLRPPSSSAPPC